MSAVIVKNILPAEIVALKAETLAEALALTTEANSLVISDVATYTTGNELFRRLRVFNEAITEQRMEVTRPIDTFKGAIIEAARQATVPLTESIKGLGNRLLKMKHELERQRQDEERAARAEAEARAKVERERREAERQAVIRRQQEERAAAEAKAKEQAELFGTEAEPIPEAEPPPPVVVVPVIEHQAVLAPLPKAAVRGNTRKTLVIQDASKIPREIAGAVLLVPDLKAIRKLMDAGIAVPGCVLETTEGFASAGGR